MDFTSTGYTPFSTSGTQIPDQINLVELEQNAMERLRRIGNDMNIIASTVSGLPITSKAKAQILSDIRFVGWVTDNFEIFCQIYKSNAASEHERPDARFKRILLSVRNQLQIVIDLSGGQDHVPGRSAERDHQAEFQDILPEITGLVTEFSDIFKQFKSNHEVQKAVEIRNLRRRIDDLTREAVRYQGLNEDLIQRFRLQETKIDVLEIKLTQANQTIEAQAASIENYTKIETELNAQIARHQARAQDLESDQDRYQGERDERQAIIQMVWGAILQHEDQQQRSNGRERSGRFGGRFWFF